MEHFRGNGETLVFHNFTTSLQKPRKTCGFIHSTPGMYQNAPHIHYKVAQHIHNGNGKYQLQSAHFFKLMLVLSMKIMPRYKMLAPATATNSIS
jgi:hypothetical protein